MKTILIIIFIISMLSSVLISCAFQALPAYISLQHYRTSFRTTSVTLLANNDINEEEEDTKKLIECSASILLPFSEEVAFDYFSDLTRQPSWCQYLTDVRYMGFVNEDDATIITTDDDIPLRVSQWTVGVKGLSFSWTANDTRISRPNLIEWESSSGLKNMGSVQFTRQAQNNSESSEIITTEMKLSFTFITPRVISSLFRRSTKIQEYTEEVLLGNMLKEFKNVVQAEVREETLIE